jgi:hypothetical protein
VRHRRSNWITARSTNGAGQHHATLGEILGDVEQELVAAAFIVSALSSGTGVRPSALVRMVAISR